MGDWPLQGKMETLKVGKEKNDAQVLCNAEGGGGGPCLA